MRPRCRDILESHHLVPGIVMLPLRYTGPDAVLAGDLTGDFADTADAAYAAGYTRTTTVVMPGSNDRDFKTNWAFHVARLGSVAAALEVPRTETGAWNSLVPAP